MKEMDDIAGEIVDAALKIHKGLGLDCWSLSMRACFLRLSKSVG
jgi:hypothetical protein